MERKSQEEAVAMNVEMLDKAVARGGVTATPEYIRKLFLTDKERAEAFKTKGEFMEDYEKNPRPKRK